MHSPVATVDDNGDREAVPSAPPATGLRAVALLEAAKGVVALLSAAGLHWLGPETSARAVRTAGQALGLRTDQGLGGWLAQAVTPASLRLAIALVVLYGALRLVEAWGLWRTHAWASWFGALGAAAYVPFELLALLRHPHWLTAAVLAINLLIVWVLARDLWRRRTR
ncbi:MAG: DUF2127 domain-containing protein [Pseudoxanthomonas suwonensis]|nr:DUF2127 domain-containing protein [Pseudoxanthomonas suwonensis]